MILDVSTPEKYFHLLGKFSLKYAVLNLDTGEYIENIDYADDTTGGYQTYSYMKGDDGKEVRTVTEHWGRIKIVADPGLVHLWKDRESPLSW